MRRRLVVLVLLGLGGCCDKELPRIDTFWLGMLAYHLPVATDLARVDADYEETNIELEAVEDSRERCLSDKGLEGCIKAKRYGFWLDLTNTSEEPITLLWPEARYVDELGAEHEVYQQPMGALPDDRNRLTVTQNQQIDSGDQVEVVIVPLYKQYQVGYGCRGEIAYSEPLIPTNLRELTEEEAFAYVNQMAEEQTPVKFVLPVEVSGERYDYVFSFTLRDWREDLPVAPPEQIEKVEELGKETDTREESNGLAPDG